MLQDRLDKLQELAKSGDYSYDVSITFNDGTTKRLGLYDLIVLLKPEPKTIKVAEIIDNGEDDGLFTAVATAILQDYLN